MTLRHDIRLATSMARPMADSLYLNIATDLGAKLKRREYAGIQETSFDPFDPLTAANSSVVTPSASKSVVSTWVVGE